MLFRSVVQLDKPAKSSIDYSRLRVADNKSFSEAWIEAVDLNDQAAKLKDDEQLALRSLQLIHNVSFLTSSPCVLWYLPTAVAPKHLICGNLWLKIGALFGL